MLDTNAVAALLKARSPALEEYTRGRPICVSVVTEAEVLYGLARRPAASALRRVAEGFLAAVKILSWDSACAACYGGLRARLEEHGQPLAPLDLLIASHALAVCCPLVSGDVTFTQVPGLHVVQWSAGEVRDVPAKAARTPRKPPSSRAEQVPVRYRAPPPRPAPRPRTK
jgi:tRNA(fMet)-specific endonuclease VapC